jgi:hypothetical protein
MATTAEDIGHLDLGEIDFANILVDKIVEARDNYREFGDNADTRTMASIAIIESFDANKGDLVTEFIVEPGDKSETILLHRGIKVIGREVVKQFTAKNVTSIGTLAEFINGDEVLIIHGTDFNVKPASRAA